MDGEIKRHFAPCTDNDPSVAKGDTPAEKGAKRKECINNGYQGGHGHVDETHDGTTGGDASEWDTGIPVGMQ